MSFASCGHCSHCVTGRPAYCYSHGSLNFGGTHPDGTTLHSINNQKVHGSFFQQSSFATNAIVNENNIVKIDKSLPLDTLAPLGCGIQTGAGAVMNSLKCGPGSTVAIFGGGGVGLSAVMAAKVSGCSKIIVIDITASRLSLSLELGATHTIQVNGKEEQGKVQEMVRKIVPDGVDFAIDTSGNKHALRSAFDSLRPLGTCALIGGAPPGTEVAIEMLSLLPGKSLRGIIQGDSVSKVFIPQLIALWQQGRLPFDRLITYYQGLESINDAVKDTHSGKAIKPVIRL